MYYQLLFRNTHLKLRNDYSFKNVEIQAAFIILLTFFGF
jgi:hypothetical protein